MKKTSLQYIEELVIRYPLLSSCFDSIVEATERLIISFSNQGKLLVCGNGGSAADSEHLVGELMKGFILPRPISDDIANKIGKVAGSPEVFRDNLQKGLPAISLVSQTAFLTAFANDKNPDFCFAQQVLAYGRKTDAFLGISTSGNSMNVVFAAQVAKALGMFTLCLTGSKESKLSFICDVTIKAPANETFKIQEYHLPIYHAISLALENEFFGVKL